MEAQVGAEVRRLHIVYFLSREDHIDHPHLIKVNHLSRNGVRLRDIKKWLGELRGKDMPDSFSWSYKRTYKSGYVWQDLMDGDLVSPISDNEYVLKGSQIKINTTKKVPKQKDEALMKENKTSFEEENQSHSSDASMYISMKSSSEIEEESPIFGSETSTLTEDSTKLETENNSDTTKHQNQEEKIEKSLQFLSSKNKKVMFNEQIISTPVVAANATSSSEPRFTKTIFRNLITCGSADTNDSAVFVINKHNRNRNFLNMCSSDERNVHASTEICKRDMNGRKNCGRVKNSIKNKNEFSEPKRVPCLAAYKPINGPNCSQCGKQFKPDKLHAHMKSCKGKKILPKIATATHEKISKSLTESRNVDSFLAFY